MEIEEVRVCADCGEVVDDLESYSLYECPECGEQFSQEDTGSHRSECCGKFSGKAGDTHEGCTALNDDAEQKWKCENECGDFHETEEEAIACDKEAAESDARETPDDRYEQLGSYQCESCKRVWVAEGGAEDGAMMDGHNARAILVDVPELTDEQLDAIFSKDGPGFVVVEAADYKARPLPEDEPEPYRPKKFNGIDGKIKALKWVLGSK